MTARWLTTATAAEHAGYHPVTIRKALESGALHGFQATAGKHWRIDPECVDAYVQGRPCPHQALGNVTPITRARGVA